MGIVNPTMGALGGARGDGETNDRNALQALLAEFNGNIDTNNLKAAAGLVAGQLDSATVQAILGLSGSGAARRGKVNIPGADTTAAVTFAIGNLGGAGHQDVVPGIVLPTDGLIAVGYQAIWQNTVGSNARAAIFLGATEVKMGNGSGAPGTAEAFGPPEVNDDGIVNSYPCGLQMAGGAGAATEITTGQILGTFTTAAQGGVCYIFAAAGTYDVSIQFKNSAAGSLTVKNRHLWVWSMGF